jgi:hypothetical protein
MKKTFSSFLDNYSFDTVILAARWQETEQLKLIGPVVEYSQSLPKLLARFSYGEVKKEAFQITKARKYNEKYLLDKSIEKIVLDAGASYVSAFDILCNNNLYITELDGIPVQFDYGHLTEEGAQLVIKDVRNIIK